MKNLIMACIIVFTGAQEVYAKPRNVSFISQRTGSETVDVGPTGSSVGDIHINKGDLLDIRTKAKIGSYIVRHIILSQEIPGGSDTRDVIIKDTLPGGTVTSVGIMTYNSGTNFPGEQQDRLIVGGTGKYEGVKGVMSVYPVDGNIDQLLVKLKFK